MELQALRYAAMVSSMTWSQAVEAHQKYLTTIGKTDDPDAILLRFLGWEVPDEENFNQDVRIVLASADFSKELTTAVLWLNERDLDIRCVRMVPYRNGSQILLDVQQVIPLPEAEEYQVRVREKASQERAARKDTSEQELRNRRFWTGLLEKACAVAPSHNGVQTSATTWLPIPALGRGFNYVLRANRGWVELYLSDADAKLTYDELYSHRSEIEAAFGGPISWVRNDPNPSCRIFVRVDDGAVDSESTWATLQSSMISSMTRFAAAFAPFLEATRPRAVPISAP